MIRERAAEIKDEGQSEMEDAESLIMHMWRQIMQLEIPEALFDSVFRTCVFIHNYCKGSVMLM